MRPIFNRETVLTAIMQAVQDRGYYHVGPCGMLTDKNGEHCLVGEVLARTGTGIRPTDCGGHHTAMAILQRSCPTVEKPAQLTEMFKQIMIKQDRGECWGEILDGLY